AVAAVPEKVAQHSGGCRIQLLALVPHRQIGPFEAALDLFEPRRQFFDRLEIPAMTRLESGAPHAAEALVSVWNRDMDLTQVRRVEDRVEFPLDRLIERARAALIVRDGVREQGPRADASVDRRDACICHGTAGDSTPADVTGTVHLPRVGA